MNGKQKKQMMNKLVENRDWSSPKCQLRLISPALGKNLEHQKGIINSISGCG